MTTQHDLDRALGAWFDLGAAAPPPPEPLARILESTRGRRPRPPAVAAFGSHWVDGVATDARLTGRPGLRAAYVVGLVALLAVALFGGAVLVGNRMLTLPLLPTPRSYLDTFVPARDLPRPVAHPVLVPLDDGRVLVIDGAGGSILYDPATGASEATGPMVPGDQWVGAAVEMRDGRVLITGDAVTQAFDPTTLEFAAVGPAVPRRSGAGLAVLPDGRVLVAGGIVPNGETPLSSAELFDPATRTFSPTGSMGIRRGTPHLTSLPDGRVFVTGGGCCAAEVYDPATGRFSDAGAPEPGGSVAVAMRDGRVVVLGSTGLYAGGSAVIWDPTARTFSDVVALPAAVNSAVPLDDGRILVTGGRLEGWSGTFDPATRTTTRIAGSTAWWPSLARLADGRVLVVGGLTDGEHPSPAVPTVQVFQ